MTTSCPPFSLQLLICTQKDSPIIATFIGFHARNHGSLLGFFEKSTLIKSNAFLRRQAQYHHSRRSHASIHESLAHS